MRTHRFTSLLFQSLLHQGISLLAFAGIIDAKSADFVSIPSSSGHQFTAGRFPARTDARPACFNPFFIRASVYCAFSGRAWGACMGVFQSLLHQGISLLRRGPSPRTERTQSVSIPSSSGHQFTGLAAQPRAVLQRTSFNPFFIRASVYWPARAADAGPTPTRFQSLLHQGISLLKCELCGIKLEDDFVSIPSSSGHQFTGPGRRRGQPRPFPFQSLLHQGISLLDPAR